VVEEDGAGVEQEPASLEEVGEAGVEVVRERAWWVGEQRAQIIQGWCRCHRPRRVLLRSSLFRPADALDSCVNQSVFADGEFALVECLGKQGGADRDALGEDVVLAAGS
jgi:hypothetical protein